jgi:predicted Fe-Mo cluster-binding NifX family protein
MKIAVITEDEKTISQHFGRAAYYLVVTVDDEKIVERELREKIGHAQFSGQEESQAKGHQRQYGQSHAQEDGHGFGRQAQDRHMHMAEAISDCEVLLCGGMGRGAYQSMQDKGIRPVVTDEPSIDAAVLAYIRGELVDHVEKLH